MTRANKTIQMRHNEAVAKGDVVLNDGFAMVALNHADANELIAYGVEGGFNFKGASSHGLVVGDKAYYVEASKEVTKTASGNTFIGRVVMIENDIVEVKINTGV